MGVSQDEWRRILMKLMKALPNSWCSQYCQCRGVVTAISNFSRYETVQVRAVSPRSWLVWVAVFPRRWSLHCEPLHTFVALFVTRPVWTSPCGLFLRTSAPLPAWARKVTLAQLRPRSGRTGSSHPRGSGSVLSINSASWAEYSPTCYTLAVGFLRIYQMSHTGGFQLPILSVSLPSSKTYILPTFKERCISEVVRIASMCLSYEKPSSSYCVV